MVVGGVTCQSFCDLAKNAAHFHEKPTSRQRPLLPLPSHHHDNLDQTVKMVRLESASSSISRQSTLGAQEMETRGEFTMEMVGGVLVSKAIPQQDRGGIGIVQKRSGHPQARQRRFDDVLGATCGRRVRTKRKSILTDRMRTGERSQDSPHLLQGQGLQEAHEPQGDAVQGRQGTLQTSPANLTRTLGQALRVFSFFSRPPSSRKESADTTASSPGTVVRRSPCSTRRPRRRRRWCCG